MVGLLSKLRQGLRPGVLFVVAYILVGCVAANPSAVTSASNAARTGMVDGVPVFIDLGDGLPDSWVSGTITVEKRDGLWCLWIENDYAPAEPVRLLADRVGDVSNSLQFDGVYLSSGDTIHLAGGSFADDRPCDEGERSWFATGVLEGSGAPDGG